MSHTSTAVGMLDILTARRRIAPWVRRTPLEVSSWLSAACGADVRLKLECQQVTHAFKARGAFNAALTLTERAERGSGRRDDRARADAAARADGAARTEAAAARRADAAERPRLVTASTGNHGRALAHAARAVGAHCVVFAPSATPSSKQQAIRAAGADLRADARDYDDAEQQAKAFAAAEDAVYVSPYNHPLIVAGTGTIGLEIVEDNPDVDVVIVPVGGGGLIGGIATAVKAIARARPGIRVIGVEAEQNPVFHTIRARGRKAAAALALGPTLADALGGNVEPDSLTIDIADRLVDDIVLVSEAAIAAAIGDLLEHDRLVVEGAGAIGVAALASRRLDVRGRSAVVVITGGNIDRARLAALLAAPAEA